MIITSTIFVAQVRKSEKKIQNQDTEKSKLVYYELDYGEEWGERKYWCVYVCVLASNVSNKPCTLNRLDWTEQYITSKHCQGQQHNWARWGSTPVYCQIDLEMYSAYLPCFLFIFFGFSFAQIFPFFDQTKKKYSPFFKK